MVTTPLMIAVDVLVGLLFVFGLAGAVLPFVPGPLLILVGAVVYAAATGFTVIAVGRLAVLALLAGLGFVLAHVAGALGARRYGGSRWAVIGAIVGAFVGVLMGPLGLLIGPAVGAVTFEMVATGEIEKSVRTGLGAMLGVLMGALAHLGVALTMIAMFLWWVWRG
jgi:uncharacterized protein